MKKLTEIFKLLGIRRCEWCGKYTKYFRIIEYIGIICNQCLIKSTGE